MGNYNPNGGRSSSSDDKRQVWPQEQPAAAHRERGNEDDRDHGSWRERNQDDRSTERYGQGQSGYSAGRYGDDRSQQMQNRNEMTRGHGNREDRDFGGDDRFSGRGARGNEPERGGPWNAYDQHRGAQERNDLRGQSDPRMGEQPWGNHMGRDRMGYQGGNQSGQDNMGYRGSEGFGGPLSGYGNPQGGYGGTPAHRAQDGGYGAQDNAWRGYDRSQDDASRTGGYNRQAPQRSTGPHRGKGPAGYQRSDERIRELASEALADDEHIDASQIQVTVKDGEVTLTGTVDDRRTRRDAEDCVANISGVRDVQVQLRLKGDRQGSWSSEKTDRSSDKATTASTSQSDTDRKPRA